MKVPQKFIFEIFSDTKSIEKLTMAKLKPQKLCLTEIWYPHLGFKLAESALGHFVLLQSVFQNISESKRALVRRVIKPTSDFAHHSFVQKGDSVTKLKFISSLVLLYSETKSVRMSIYVIVSRLIPQTVFQEEIAPFFEAVIPRYSELVVPFVDFCLHWPLKVEHHGVISEERRPVANISTKSACPVPIDILLDISEKRSFSLRLHEDARIIVGVLDFFVPLFEQKQIHLMSDLGLLQFLLVLSLHYVFESLFFLGEQLIQILELLFIVLLNVANVLLSLCSKVHLDFFIKPGFGHFVQNTLQSVH